MTTLPLDWAADNAWLTFWCAWPLSFLLVSIAWFVTDTIIRGANILLQIVSLLVNGLVISLRGYAPQSEEAHAGEDDDTPTGTT